MWHKYLNCHQKMGILNLKKRVHRDKCSFIPIDEILRYRWTRFVSSRTLCHPGFRYFVFFSNTKTSDIEVVALPHKLPVLAEYKKSIYKNSEYMQSNSSLKGNSQIRKGWICWCQNVSLSLISDHWLTFRQFQKKKILLNLHLSPSPYYIVEPCDNLIRRKYFSI